MLSEAHHKGVYRYKNRHQLPIKKQTIEIAAVLHGETRQDRAHPRAHPQPPLTILLNISDRVLLAAAPDLIAKLPLLSAETTAEEGAHG